jgi:hypothetical protein
MHWLIQKGFNAECDKLAEIISKQAGASFDHITIDSLSSNCYGDIVKGSIEFCQTAYDYMAPMTRVEKEPLWDNYACSVSYPKFGDYLLNDRYCFLPASEIVRKQWWLWKTFGEECEIFMRPDSGLKRFTGGLFDIQNIERGWSQCYDATKDKDYFVLIAKPQAIKGEWRIAINNDEIIGISSYRCHGLETQVPHAPKEITDLASRIIRNHTWRPDNIFTLDLALLPNDQAKFIEVNAFCSSGLYAMDLKKLIQKLS